MNEADLLRENAELTASNVELERRANDNYDWAKRTENELRLAVASNARLREALVCSRRHVNVLTEKLASKKMFVAYDKSEILSDAVLAEPPAQSLAAITQPLEAHITELRTVLKQYADERNWKSINSQRETTFHPDCAGWFDRFGPHHGYTLAKEALARTPADSLKAIQDAYWKKIHAAMMQLITLRGINSRSAIADFVLDLENLHEYVDAAAKMARRANNGKTWQEEIQDAAKAEEREARP